jgi:hypothetical protein
MPVPGTTSSKNHAEEADCCVVDRSCRTPPPLFLNRPLNQRGERLWSRHWQCSPWSANRFLRGSGARREGGHAQPARSNGLTAARLTTAEKEPEPRQQLVAIRAQRTRAGVVASRIQSRMSGSDGTTVRRVTHWWPRSNAPRGPARPASDGPLPGRRRHRDRAERARAFFPPPAKPPNRFTARCRHRPQIAHRTDHLVACDLPRGSPPPRPIRPLVQVNAIAVRSRPCGTWPGRSSRSRRRRSRPRRRSTAGRRTAARRAGAGPRPGPVTSPGCR